MQNWSICNADGQEICRLFGQFEEAYNWAVKIWDIVSVKPQGTLNGYDYHCDGLSLWEAVNTEPSKPGSELEPDEEVWVLMLEINYTTHER